MTTLPPTLIADAHAVAAWMIHAALERMHTSTGPALAGEAITDAQVAHAVHRTAAPTVTDTRVMLHRAHHALGGRGPHDDPLPIEPAVHRLTANLKIPPG